MAEVHRSATLAVSLPSAARLLEVRPTEVLSGGQADPTFGAEIAGVHLSRRVRIIPGDVEQVSSPVRAAVLPFSVEAEEAHGWFPVLEAELQVVQIGPSRIELALDGRYRVPGSVVGVIADRVALARVAEQSIGRFFDAVVGRIARNGKSADALTGVPT